MASRCRLLLLQLAAIVAAASCLLAAGSCPVDAAPRMQPPRGVPAATAVAPPPAGIPRTAVDDDTGVPTMAAPDAATAAIFFSGTRRLVRLSGIPADAPAAAPSDVHHATAGQSLVVIFSPVFFVLGCGLFVAGLFKSADLYAAAKARREKARRVRPLGQDAAEAAAGP
jgi:hypothetical protein